MKNVKKSVERTDKTELVWPGKRTEVERVELPFQTIETINLPRGSRQESIFNAPLKQTKLVEDRERQPMLSGHDPSWKNRLIWGDNLLVMGSLLKEFAGKINLIYIDPPFATGDDFSFEVQIGDEEITKEPSALEVKAYRDTWGKGMQSYLQMMYDRLVLMKELLADNGSIYVHLDWHVAHYIKLMLDEIFGKDNFRNEIIWCYTSASNPGKDFPKKHDNILRYSKSADYIFNTQDIRVPYDEKTLANYKEGLAGSGTFYEGKIKDTLGLLKEGKVPEDWWEFAITARYRNRSLVKG